MAWWRRRAEADLPDGWWSTARARVAVLDRLDAAQRDRLEAHVRDFLGRVRFVGAAGQEVTDEVRVVIAAQACLLALGRDGPPFPDTHEVVVYPAAFQARHVRHGPGGVVSEGVVTRTGESWVDGTVVLSWDDTLRGAAADDGRNVVLHEFAHQLDAADDRMDGAPVLEARGQAAPWARVLGRAYAGLVDDLAVGARPWLRPYGATEPAEFFAVVTEAFFEQPRALQRQDPDLYGVLAGFYRLDPAAWAEG